MSRSKVRNLFKFKTKSTTDLSEWNKNDDKLMKAVEVGDVKKVNSILTKKTLIPTKLGPRGHSVFHIACAVGNDQIVELLLKYSEDVNDLTIQGNTALQLAAAKGHNTVVERLLMAGADVDMRDSNNMTALHHACAGLHVGCVQVLLSGNANPQIKEKTGKTPLFFAAHRGNVDICKWLVDKGADVNAHDTVQITSLIVAAKEGHKKVCEFLLKKGASPDHTDRDGRNALAFALAAGHPELRDVFARAPTRASWTVHANNVEPERTNKTEESVKERQSPTHLGDQVDVVSFVRGSPTVEDRHLPNLENTEAAYDRKQMERAGENHLVVKQTHSELQETSSLHPKAMADQKTLQAFRELEEEHEQLNEEFHKLSIENLKLQDKVEFLQRRGDNKLQSRTEIPQEIADELKNLKNLLEEEKEKNRDLEHQMESTRANGRLEQEEREQSTDTDITNRDSWGDSDDEMYDPSAKKMMNKNSPDDKQMLALLRGQILAVRQENDQLKEKLESQRSLVEVMTEGGDRNAEVEELQQRVSSLEEEKLLLQQEVLKVREKTEIELFNGAIDHEELISENKRLQEELFVTRENLMKAEELQQKAPSSDVHVKDQSAKVQKGSEIEKTGDEVTEGLTRDENGQDLTNVEFLQTQNEQLKDQCELLSDELEKLRETFDAILKAGDNLQGDFDQLQNEKEKLQEEFDKTCQEKDELASENEFLLSDGNALHEDLKKLVHELEKMQEKFKKVQKEKEELERNKSAVELSGKPGEFAKLLDERDKLQHRCNELDKTTTSLQHDQTILMEEVQSLQEQISTLQQERDQVQPDLDEVEVLLQQHEVLQQDYNQLEQDFTELLKDKEKLEQELLDGQTESVKIERTSAADNQEELIKENMLLTSEKEQLELTIGELSKANALLEEELTGLQSELEHAQSNHLPSLSEVDVTLQAAVIAEKDQHIESQHLQITRLQQQLAEFDRRHREVVGTYRTHLISAVQGHMDPDVKKALHHIIEIRSMEQFC